MTTPAPSIEQRLSQLPTPKRGRPKATTGGFLENITIKEYRQKKYLERKPAVTKNQQRKINKMGITTLLYLRNKGYTYEKISTVIPRSTAFLNITYRQNQEFVNDPDYQTLVKFIDSNIPMFGPLEEIHFQQPPTHPVEHIIATSASL
jgi:hypothetical protein